MSLSELKTAAAALAVATLVTTGAGVYAYQQPGRGARARAAAPRASSKSAGQPAGGLYNLTEPADNVEGPGHFLDAIRDHDAQVFDKILRGRQQVDARTVDRLAHWSRAVKDAEEYLSNDPANVAAARQGHRDRMKRLHELTQSLKGPNQPEVADTARVWFQQAERDLNTGDGAQPRPAGAQPVDSEEWRRMSERRLRAADQTRKNQERQPGEAAADQPRPKSEPPAGEPGPANPSFPSAATTTNPPRGAMMGGMMPGMGGMMPGMGGMGGMGGMPGMMAGMMGWPGMGGGGKGGQGGMGGGGMDGGGMAGKPTRTQMGHMRVGIAGLAREVAAHDKSPATKKVLAKLDEPIAMSFAHETPLDDVLKYIKAATSSGKDDPGIPIYVDPVGLEEAETSLKSKIQMDLEGVPLKTTLRLLLKQLDLAYCVKDGILIISSVPEINLELEEAESEQKVGQPVKEGGIQ